MKKSILNLKGVQQLSKNELKETAGGLVFNPGGGNGPGEDGCGFNTCRNKFGRCSWSACDRGY
ncbi:MULTISPECIES: hypothetical protein [Flavobacterium]|uniref:Bacteriocin-type signal sequence-containing protein n=1 Tax=Flavobacterium jumunjinense TaxID=998845 RepID=A0ABV5GKM2_9FLAO|nr:MULTISPECIES: hypothetical protein [Flavobacterium]